MGRRLVPMALGAAIWVLAAGTARAAGPGCAACHDQPERIAGTAHASLSCLFCHPGRETVPHPAGAARPPACADCHEEEADGNRLGIHGQAVSRGDPSAPGCGDCHGDAHGILRPGTEAFLKGVPGLCGACHGGAYADYKESVHGQAAAKGIVAAPVCSTCHGGHLIRPPEAGASPVHPRRVPATCGRCHGDVMLTERFDLPRATVASFEESVHGLALSAGSPTVANCASCHGVHRILPSSDPRSSISPENLPETCGRCHPGAGSRFAIGHIHWGENAPPPAPVRWIRAAYLILIPLVIGAMALHNLGDWMRKVLATRFHRARAAGEAPAADRPAPPRDPSRLRMYPFERVEHGLLLLSFAVLVWSGFALIHPERWWARPLVALEFRAPVRGTVHRIAGAVLLALAFLHLASLAASRTLRRHWMALVPRRADAVEAAQAFAHNVGLRRKPPRPSSQSYAEKAEYWALVWGTALMGITGIMLWANTFILAWLPKTALDIALALHFYEAVLATLAIVVWHFYFVIFDPAVYPMDPSWITGYTVRESGAAGEGAAGEAATRGTADPPGAGPPGTGNGPPGINP